MPEPELGFAASLLLPERSGSPEPLSDSAGWTPRRWVAAAPPDSSPAALVGHLARRVALRPGAVRGASRLLPLRPASLRTGPRAAVRRWAYSGAIVLPAGEDFPSPRSPLGRVAAEAGVSFPVATFWPGSGGSFVAPARLGAEPVVLRVFAPAATARFEDAERTLRHLEAHAVARVPRALASGRTDGLPWLVESRMPGRRPRQLSERLLGQAVDFCVGLPADGRPAVAGLERLPPVLDPGPAQQLDRLARESAAQWSGARPVGTHGDFWAGNLLETGDGLAGVVDWDAYRTDPVPGLDLVHLVATAERLARRRSMGAEVLSRPWTRDPLRSAVTSYAERLDLRLDEDRWTAIGVAWWLGQLVDTLTRTPELASDEAWTSRNIGAVLAAI